MTLHVSLRRLHRLLGLAVVLAATPAAATLVPGTNAYSVETPAGSQSQQTQDLSITFGAPFAGTIAGQSGTQNFAVAAGPNLTLRSMAFSGGSASDLAGYANTNSAFRWDVTIGSGSSGLANGTPVTLSLGLRVDGRLAAGEPLGFGACPGCGIVLSGEYGNSAEARAKLSFGVSDTGSPNYEDGVPDLLDFTYDGYLSYGGGNFAVNPGPIVASTFMSVAHATLQSGANWAWSGNQDTLHSEGPGDPIGARTEDIDTGLLLFTFDTFVGRTLRFDADLQTFASGSALNLLAWRALADFGNTFDAELSSQVAGLAFSNYQSGVFADTIAPAPVPEPQTWALMLSGLSALGLLARRRGAAARDRRC